MAEIVTMPKLGFDMAEGTLVRWMITEGGEVAKGAVLAEIETDKATVEVEASASGILYRYLVEEGAVVPVGTPIAVIAAPGEEVKDLPTVSREEAPAGEPAGATAEAAPQQVEIETEASEASPVVEESGRLKASPLARRMAQDLNLDLSSIKGSGPGGRIVKKDLGLAAQAGQAAPVAKQPAAAGVAPAKPGLPAVEWTPGAPVPADERIPLAKLRALIGKRMVEAKREVPHFYITSVYDAGPLMELRTRVNQQLPEDAKASVNDFLIKAVALTLRGFPNLNASLTDAEIVRHGHVNIGVAVAVENGLMTVVVKDADQKPLRLISQEVREMVSRARQGKVKPEDIEGSTFSISNLGMYGVDEFIAIINPPEAGILAVGAVQQVPVVENGEVKAGMRLKATISADHRISDGAEAAQFMQALGEFIENPLRLFL